MSCTPVRPCGEQEWGLGLVAPPPGQQRLRRRVGEFHGFLADLIARIERQEAADGKLGSLWDVEGDPQGKLLAELWAYVAESVAAYAELTAGEAYLGTAADWTDLRRLASLVGYRPHPRIAAQGWVRVEVEKGADPVMPAGTRVQAPGTPERAAQTFEVVAETQLRSEWDGLTATWVPEPEIPSGREVRFLGDPGFRAGDRVLFVLESAPEPPTGSWFDYWLWLLDFFDKPAGDTTVTPLAIASVVESTAELGTTLVRFDRNLDSVLDSETAPYAAYRILATAGAARRLEAVLSITSDTVTELPLAGDSPIPDLESIILDSPLEDLSAGQLAAVVDWTAESADVVGVEAHTPVSWAVAPGTKARVSKLRFETSVPALDLGNPVTVYIVDRRVVARHYTFPSAMPEGPAQLRLYPRPLTVPAHVAVGVVVGAATEWEVFACAESSSQEAEGADGSAPSGLVVDLVDGAPETLVRSGPASGNLVRVRHGAAASAALGSGDAALAGQRFTIPDAPIASDLEDAGTPVSSLELRADGIEWIEVPSLYGVGLEQAYVTRLGTDGAVTVEFGDGVRGARLPTGRNNVTAVYRVGGGKVGEVESEAIETLLGSIKGVKKVRGAGPTSGGADQDDELDLRRLAPTRARAFDRAVSREDLVDLSLGYPGAAHAAAWNGAGPPGCACGGSGLHLAFLRSGTEGPRAPEGAEIDQLAAYLDARRDVTVPLCVCGGIATPLLVTAAVAVDPRQEPSVVAGSAEAALLVLEGPLAPRARSLGQALDRSDVYAVLHGVPGVIGVTSLDLPGAGELGRRSAERFELLLVDAASTVVGEAA